MSMSRPNRMSSPCSPSTPTTTDTNDADPDTLTKQPPFPRFLVVQCADPQKKLRDQNSDITDRTIRGVTSSSVIIQWMGPALLVEVSHEAYAHNLLKVTQIGELPVKVSPHRSMNSRKGVVKFGRAANGMSNDEVKDALNSSPRNRDMPFVAEAFRVSVNRNNERRPTGTFYLTFQGTSLPQRVRLGFERFDVNLYIPFPRRCFKCQKYGHNSRTCWATADVCPLCSGTGHKQDSCPNKESLKCANCNGPHSATSRECPAYISEKRALQIQAETHCTLPAAREQAGQTPAEPPAAREQAEQTTTTEPAASSFAQVVAHSQADLVNRNLALSDENARLKEVIVTLRRANASLQQRLDGYEHRLHALEQSMVGGAHPDTPLVGVQNTTPVGSAHNTTPVGSAHNSTPVEDAHNPTSVGDAHTSSVSTANMASQTENGNTSGPYASVSPQLLRAQRPTDAPSYIYRQSPTPKKKVELNRKGPSSIPVTSPITKSAELRNHRKNTAKQTKA